VLNKAEIEYQSEDK